MSIGSSDHVAHQRCAWVGYSAQLEATGGVFPCLWLLATNSSVLPPGLTLSTNGLLSGVPGSAGTYDLVVQVFDSFYHTTTQALPLVITTINQLPPGLLLSTPAHKRVRGYEAVGYQIQDGD